MQTNTEVQNMVSIAQTGDKEAFRVLYNTLSPRVFRFIRPRARNREDALDVMQETFIDFWKNLSSFVYQDDKALDAFLYRIASRKLGRLFRIFHFTASLELIDDIIIDESVENPEINIDVSKALAILKSRDREIVVLRDIEGRSFAEISEILGDSENTLKVRHHRALLRLRKNNHE